MKMFLLSVISLSLLACKSGPKPASPPDTIGNQMLIKLSSSPCRGYCPVYSVLFYANGSAIYTGERFVQKEGEFRFQLNNADTHALNQAVEQANLWQYPDHFETMIMDAPSATLTVYRDDMNYSVWGTIDSPKAFLDLQEMLLTLAEKNGLQIREGVNPNEIPAERMQELTVLLEPDINAGNWIMQFSEFKLQLVRRTGEANQWIVRYDNTQIGKDAVVKMLMNSKGALKVE